MIAHRTMSRDDLETALGWAADEGWNPGLDDAEAFLAADPGGFFVAVEDGAPVAAIAVCNHSDRYAFLGLYLCRPSHRGRGISYALWQTAMAHAGDRTVGLDGVPDQQANYARSGFVRAAETTRYVGTVTVTGVAQQAFRPATDRDIPALVAIEAEASGWSKPAYLGAWFTETRHRRTLVASSQGDVAGFATVRACRDGAKIGPLWARDETTARALILRASEVFGGPVTLDVPSTATGLDGLCRTLGLVPGFHTARMYRGPQRQGAGDFCAPATLELG